MGLENAAKTSAHMRRSGREGLELYSHDGIPLDCWSQQEGTGPGGLLGSSIPQGDLRPYYTLGLLSDLGFYKALDSEVQEGAWLDITQACPHARVSCLQTH